MAGQKAIARRPEINGERSYLLSEAFTAPDGWDRKTIMQLAFSSIHRTIGKYYGRELLTHDTRLDYSIHSSTLFCLSRYSRLELASRFRLISLPIDGPVYSMTLFC
jgi:hypothetical protein